MRQQRKNVAPWLFLFEVIDQGTGAGGWLPCTGRELDMCVVWVEQMMDRKACVVGGNEFA